MAALEALESGTPPTLLHTHRAHGSTGEITCCDVSAGGARLLTGGGDRALRAWRWAAGSGWELQAVAARAHRYGITVARWSPGGALAVSGGVDGAARVWSARELTPRRLLAAPGAPGLRALSWAGAGILVCGYDDGAACVWHVRRATLLARLHAHQGALHAIGTLARGALLLTACTEGVLKVFDFQEVCRCSVDGAGDPSPLLWVDGAHDLGALCCDVTAAGDIAATGGHDSRVRLWTVLREGEKRTVAEGVVLEGHGAAVTAVRWGARLLATAALDRTARVWSAAGACLVVLHAHNRYLTCVALAPDLRYMVTGSNDKTVRTWALGELNLNDELEPECNPMAHFGVGDLEGIGPVDDDELLASDGGAFGSAGEEAEGRGEAGAARLVCGSMDAHGGSVNCISVHGDLLATACSDGVVRMFRWTEDTLQGCGELGERGYPALAADLGANGAVLLTAGLDGAAKLWDVESGCVLRTLAPPAAAEHESGGGGTRGARVSPHRPPLLLLATDDGVAPLWSLADPDPKPTHVFGGHVEAATCCAWSWCGRAAATGGAAGELRIIAPPPPLPRTLAHVADAHDLGVQSCDFAPEDAVDLPPDTLLLATAGSDALIKLWWIHLDEDVVCAQVTVAASVVGHGGGAASARWGARGLLATAGADGWARVWRPRGGEGRGAVRLQQIAAVPAQAAAGTAAAVLLDSDLLVLGSLSGELAVWRLPMEQLANDEGLREEEGDAEDAADVDAGADPQWWGAVGVARWIRDYITRVPGDVTSSEVETELLSHAREAGLTGAMLLDTPIEELLQMFGYGPLLIKEAEDEPAKEEDGGSTRARLIDELSWLRREPPSPHLAQLAPHWLLCPLTHALCREPARAADGVTYDRLALHEWFLAADGAVSAVSGRRLRNARVVPNYAARAALRQFLGEHQQEDD